MTNRAYIATCTECDPSEPRYFRLERNRDDWIHGHKRLTNHKKVSDRVGERPMDFDEVVDLMQP